MEGVSLEFSKGAIRKIAEKANGKNTGARGLRTILENLMMDLMYEVPSRKTDISEVSITEEMVEKGTTPLPEERKTSEEVA